MDRSSSPPVERRRDPRARASFPLVLTPSSGPLEAEVRDVSRSGVCATAARPVPEMMRVRLRFDLPSPEGPRRIEGVGAVVRCARRAEAIYEIGILFTEMADADRDRLAEFVRASARD